MQKICNALNVCQLDNGLHQRREAESEAHVGKHHEERSKGLSLLEAL